MSKTGPHHDDRVLQLLADRATEGISRSDAAVLDNWLATEQEIAGDAFDRAAAVVELTQESNRNEVLPTALRRKLYADAEAFFAKRNET